MGRRREKERADDWGGGSDRQGLMESGNGNRENEFGLGGVEIDRGDEQGMEGRWHDRGDDGNLERINTCGSDEIRATRLGNRRWKARSRGTQRMGEMGDDHGDEDFDGKFRVRGGGGGGGGRKVGSKRGSEGMSGGELRGHGERERAQSNGVRGK